MWRKRSVVFFLENEKWVMHWVDAESDFQFENVQKISKDGKMSFLEWLEEEQGITPEEWDENYSDEMAKTN